MKKQKMGSNCRANEAGNFQTYYHWIPFWHFFKDIFFSLHPFHVIFWFLLELLRNKFASSNLWLLQENWGMQPHRREEVQEQLPTHMPMYSIGTSQSMQLSINIHNTQKTVKKTNALLDSGAASMFINKDIIKEYGWKTKTLEKLFRLINANGTPNEEKVKETILIHYYIKNPKTGENVFQQM
jgi:hypothetical protein